MQEEFFEIYDEQGRKVGLAPRAECHGNPALIHCTAHVVVFHPDGRLLLQKRSIDKDIQPGKWDTAVGGHVMPGEDYLTAARREMGEELGVTDGIELRHLFDSKIRNDIESEDVRVFGCTYEGPFEFQIEEIDEVKFWSSAELFEPEARKNFTPNLLIELDLLVAHDLIKKDS